ncbi:proline-, glutamic acid- and leucine-rich protein 1-like isoform X2 [Brassica napus]|uniref:proline-, glutamic acid- and leucine-rich protein 1-like isoform X2 n=1 Tax=Brassica napus TaxID=3708 RepID=UPI0020787747|nr:proline-, glutamic acid- and leucine-rich protein 1-like isoform X2 [Brassica napus]
MSLLFSFWKRAKVSIFLWIAVMAPRGRRKAGLTRADAARDAMRAFGFAERLINVCIKELLEVYGEGGWFLIEECSYSVLLHKCLEKSDEQDKNLAEDGIEERAEEQNLEMADAEEQEQEDNEMVEAEQDQNQEMVEAGQDQNVEMVEAGGQEPTPQLEEKQKEQEQQVEDGRGDVGSNSTSLVGGVAETGAKTCQTEALSTTSVTDILDSSSPAGEASVIDYVSPAADASGGFAQRPAEGVKSSGCGGWISDSDEDEDPDAVSVGDDDEIIQLTPEPLCEELEELVKELQGEKKKKRTRWED